MEIGRRPVLQGLAAAGITTATAGFRSEEDPSPVRSSPCCVLTEGRHGERFAAGVRSVLADGDVIQEIASLDLASLTRILAAGPQRLILGLVNDGVAAVAVEMARDAGARLRWLGHHTVRDGESRHRLLTATHEGGVLFARALDECAAPFVVTACDLSPGHSEEFATTREIGVNPMVVDWAAALGRVLALAHADGASPYRPLPIPPAVSGDAANSGSFVSFILEL